MTIFIGVQKIIEARWTCIFELHEYEKGVTKAHILFYGRNCYEGYEKEYPEVSLTEDVVDRKERTVTHLTFEGKIYEVENPCFVFDYGAGNN